MNLIVTIDIWQRIYLLIYLSTSFELTDHKLPSTFLMEITLRFSHVLFLYPNIARRQGVQDPMPYTSLWQTSCTFTDNKLYYSRAILINCKAGVSEFIVLFHLLKSRITGGLRLSAHGLLCLSDTIFALKSSVLFLVNWSNTRPGNRAKEIEVIFLIS